MSLNLRDCSAGNLEVDAGLVWGERGNGTCYAGKTLCQNPIIPQVMALGMWHSCVWCDITIQIQLLRYSRQGTDFSLPGAQSHLPPATLCQEWNPTFLLIW